MLLAKMTPLVALMLAAPAFSAPTPEHLEPWELDPDWLPRGGNFSVPHNYDTSLARRSAECKSLEARESDDVIVNVYDNSIMTFGYWSNEVRKGIPRPISPPTFTNLWNDVVAASCNTAECGEHIGKAKTPQHMGGMQGALHMWLEGEFFGAEERDALVYLLRESFDRAVVREFSDNGYQMYEWGPKDLFAKHRDGQSLRAVIRTKTESEEGCGDILSRIIQAGELVSPLFGLVSIACATKVG